MKRVFMLLACLAFACGTSRAAEVPFPKPNILYILADDLGYGDVHCLNPARGKIGTPNLDRLAGQGMVFTDAHAGSSVCTPSRYGILTGRYAWRTRLQTGVLGGFSPPLIGPGQLTVPAFLKQHGFATACIGKWHLGMTWPRRTAGKFGDGISGAAESKSALNDVDWTKPVRNGPTTIGFDSFFGISASLDMPPFVFIRNDRVTEVPTVEKKWLRSGPAAAGFEAGDVLPKLVEEAAAAIESLAAGAKAGKPFFLYLPLTSPHTPILPGKNWKGKSGLGDYGDFVMETDWAVGEVIASLEKSGTAGNTLVIVTSDNGCSPAAGTARLEAKGHFPSAGFRGYKSDIWDGGHRIPFIVRWPDRVKAGSQCPETVCLTDLMATCADILGARLPDNAGEDSASILPALTGKGGAPHEAVVHHSINGMFAIRQGRWKLELCAGSGGWGEPRDDQAAGKGLPNIQLYDLDADPAETKNLKAEHPDVVARLTAILEQYVRNGRSTPGPKQPNDSPVKIFKPDTGNLNE